MEQTLDQKMEELTQIYELVDDVYDGYAASFGITDAELWVLYALSRHNGDYLQTDICRRWYYSLQTHHTTIQEHGEKGPYHPAVPARKPEKQVPSPDGSGETAYGKDCGTPDAGGKGRLFRADPGRSRPSCCPCCKSTPRRCKRRWKSSAAPVFWQRPQISRPSGGPAEAKRPDARRQSNRSNARNFKPNGKRPDCPPAFLSEFIK